MNTSRRSFIRNAAAIAGACVVPMQARAHVGTRVVIIGGGYAGATCAKYIRKWAADIHVTLVERSREFVSCPVSNLVIAGTRTLSSITLSYAGLEKHGVKVVQGEAVAIDPVKKTVRLASGEALPYDRLVVAPGVDPGYDTIPGQKSADAQKIGRAHV